jgi:hypothetical protein
MCVRTSLAVVLLAAASALAADAPAEKVNAHAQYKVEVYLKAFRAEDVDAVMKQCGVPFLMNDRGKMETEAALRQELRRLFDRGDMSTMTFTVKAVGTLDEVKGKLAEPRHADKLKDILREGDRVVLVDAEFGKDKRKENLVFAVGPRGGQVRVNGMLD